MDIKAIIFDMDGVLLDTETMCDTTWEMTAKEMGISDIDKSVNICRGSNLHDTLIKLKEIYGKDFDSEHFMSRTSELFHEIEETKGIPLMYYAKEILQYLSKKYHVALASSTRGPTVKRQLTNAGLIDYFETLTTGDMVTHSKPNPEIYSLACKSLNLNPNECVAIEDSPNGIKSAITAGMSAIMIPDKIKATSELEKMCYKIFNNLEGLKEIF